jgi:hypothetical protein
MIIGILLWLLGLWLLGWKQDGIKNECFTLLLAAAEDLHLTKHGLFLLA